MSQASPTAQKIMEYLACPCEYFAPRKNEGEIFEAYHRAFEEGQSRGFTPLLIVPDEILWEQLVLHADNAIDDPKATARRREADLNDAAALDPLEFFAEMFAEEIEMPEPGPIEGDNILAHFSSHWDYDNKQTHEMILAQIPTDKPWELAAWLPMGGFNTCPLPHSQAAIMKRWYETYEARPVLVTCDAWEFSVPQALADKAEALKLAYEHYAFCPDRVENYGREEYRLGNLADSLMKSKIWYFSWE